MRWVTGIYLVSIVVMLGLVRHSRYQGKQSIPLATMIAILLSMVVFSNDAFRLTSHIHSSFGTAFAGSSQWQELLHTTVLVWIVLYVYALSTTDIISRNLLGLKNRELIDKMHSVVTSYLTRVSNDDHSADVKKLTSIKQLYATLSQSDKGTGSVFVENRPGSSVFVENRPGSLEERKCDNNKYPYMSVMGDEKGIICSKHEVVRDANMYFYHDNSLRSKWFPHKGEEHCYTGSDLPEGYPEGGSTPC